MPPSLAEVESLVEQLTKEDRAKLRARLAEAEFVQGNEGPNLSDADAAWANFWKIGAELAAAPSVNGKSLLQQLSEDRR